MKTSARVHLASLLFIASGVAPLHAIVDGSQGVDMGQVPEGVIYNMLPLLPFTDFGVGGGWAAPNEGWSQMVVSVGQLMGLFDDGSSIPYTDLVPFATHSFQVRGPAGKILTSGADGTVLSGSVTMTEPQGDISMGIYQ